MALLSSTNKVNKYSSRPARNSLAAKLLLFNFLAKRTLEHFITFTSWTLMNCKGPPLQIGEMDANRLLYNLYRGGEEKLPWNLHSRAKSMRDNAGRDKLTFYAPNKGKMKITRKAPRWDSSPISSFAFSYRNQRKIGRNEVSHKNVFGKFNFWVLKFGSLT